MNKFCRQPNGLFLKYNETSHTIEEFNIYPSELLEHVIQECAWIIQDKYEQVKKLVPGQYFDEYILGFYPKSLKENSDEKTWLRYFKLMGCSKDELKEVKKNVKKYKAFLKDCKRKTEL